MIASLLSVFVLSWAALCPAQEARHAGARSDALLLVESGNIPLILGAPHGGSHFPDDWPVRSQGVKVRDTNTYEIAVALRDAIRRRVGGEPHLVASRVHRRHLDLNRNREESGANLGEAQLALWADYHEAIERATTDARANGKGRALLIDLHGHGHDHGLIELGFAISADKLREEPTQLEDEAWVRGPKSLGARLDVLGWKSVPSPTRPAPKVGQSYFNGGYTVRRHRGDGLRSIQIELPPRPRRLGAEGRQPLVEGLADAILGLLASEFAVSPIPLDPKPAEDASLWGPGEHLWSAAVRRDLKRVAKELPSYVDVYGIPVLAAEEVSNQRLRDCAAMLARHFDADSNRLLDDVQALDRLRRNGFAILLYQGRAPVLTSTRPWKRVELVQTSSFEEWLGRFEAQLAR